MSLNLVCGHACIRFNGKDLLLLRSHFNYLQVTQSYLDEDLHYIKILEILGVVQDMLHMLIPGQSLLLHEIVSTAFPMVACCAAQVRPP